MNTEIIEPTEEEYRDLLNECYPEVQIGQLFFLPSRIIEELDPIAFRCGYNDYCSESTRYKCGKCNTEYDIENKAEECCQENKGN